MPTYQRPGEPPPPDPPNREIKVPAGVIIGNAVASIRVKDANANTEAKDYYLLNPGDPVVLAVLTVKTD